MRCFYCMVVWAILFVRVDPVDAASPREFALAPASVADVPDAPRPQRMLDMLSRRVELLKKEGRNEEAHKAIRQAHQRVRQSRRESDQGLEDLHRMAERIGDGREVDIESIPSSVWQSQFKALRKKADQCIANDDRQAAARSADQMHKEIRLDGIARTKRFQTLHRAIDKIAQTHGIAPADQPGAKERAGHATRHAVAEDARQDKKDALAGNAHSHGTDHAPDASDSFNALQEEIRQLRAELEEVRALAASVRNMIK